jgi:hypothetical protein
MNKVTEIYIGIKATLMNTFLFTNKPPRLYREAF